MQFILLSGIIPSVTRALAAPAQLTSFSRECISSSRRHPRHPPFYRCLSLWRYEGPGYRGYPLVTSDAAFQNFSPARPLARARAHVRFYGSGRARTRFARNQDYSRVVAVAGETNRFRAPSIDDTAKIVYARRCIWKLFPGGHGAFPTARDWQVG